MERVAARFGVDPACVVMPGGGCSFANHLALAAMLSPGDEALVETPTYELLTSLLGYLQARVRTFERRADEAWRLDPDRIAAAITPATRVVVLTNLHNPTSAPADDAAIAAIAAAADRVGAMVFVDEVYRELTFADGRATTSFREDGNVVVTSSLTKAYGVSGLRCGWILAPAPLAERMRRLNDLFGVHPPHVAERHERRRLRPAAALARPRHGHRRRQPRRLPRDPGRPSAARADHVRPGRLRLPAPRRERRRRLLPRLTTDYETSVAPGRFFGLADHIRIGLGADPDMTREGLTRVAAALDG